MKRFSPITLFVILFLIPAGSIVLNYFYPRFFPEAHQRKFVKQWEQIFKTVSKPSDVQLIPFNKGRDLVYLRTFQDGTWIVARHQPFAGKKDLSMTILMDNKKQIYVANVSFDGGQDGFQKTLNGIEANSAEVFIQKSKDLNLIPQS